MEDEPYKDLGHKSKAKPPTDFKKIRVHFVCDVKHDGRHKQILAIDGHLIEVPSSSVYYGAVSLKGIMLVTFLAELCGLESWGADIVNSYLESKTKEKFCIASGPEFFSLKNYVLVITKVLHGLRTSCL